MKPTVSDRGYPALGWSKAFIRITGVYKPMIMQALMPFNAPENLSFTGGSGFFIFIDYIMPLTLE
jgi:hypothetical protein